MSRIVTRTELYRAGHAGVPHHFRLTLAIGSAIGVAHHVQRKSCFFVEHQLNINRSLHGLGRRSRS
jgi:hypothetical protein